MQTDTDDDDWMEDDEVLLERVPQSQLQDLCQQLNLTTEGTKEELLLRLRAHAKQQIASEQNLQRDRKMRVEAGGNDDSRERHEIVGSDNFFESGEEEEGFFYLELPTTIQKEGNQENNNIQKQQQQQAKKHTRKPVVTQSDVLAPPPPPPGTPVNEHGERIVTVYSTTDHNDLTGVAAAQPGQAAMSGMDPMAAGSSSESQPWDMDQTNSHKVATTRELEQAKETVTELVQTLLAMTGAPAFSHFDVPEELLVEDVMSKSKDELDSYTASVVSKNNNNNFDKTATFGFDPSRVPGHLLTEASQALRANRGQVLQEVLREFEIQAVGQDGMAGDKVEDGGGHFKEVAKVRAFLEGFRRAQVRKASRDTVTFLLDKLVSEGVEGLDLTLATMTRSNDDSASEVDSYELNDSLISYLSDIIRDQEKKVDRLKNGQIKEEAETRTVYDVNDDPINKLWNQTTGDDGESIESINPKDPKVQQILQQELKRGEQGQVAIENSILVHNEPIPETAPEKMLLLLGLLRERLKTEAAFANDERSRNLRVLAYCLKCRSELDQEELIMKGLGSSVDKLDSFLELVASSIEYAESTSHQLQPAKHMPLNVKVLKRILKLTETIREKRVWKSAGLKP